MDNQPPIIEHSSPPSLLGYRSPDPSVSQNAAIKYVKALVSIYTIEVDNVCHSTQIGQIEGTKSVDVTGRYLNSGLWRV